MTNQEVLTKAIEKAIANGWDYMGWKEYEIYYAYGVPSGVRLYEGSKDVYMRTNDLLFSHDFAKALWGERHSLLAEPWKTDWQFHLQQMVIADDPLAYLAENL